LRGNAEINAALHGMMDNGSSGFGAVYNDKIRAGWDLC
jgi:hypothetical protein